MPEIVLPGWASPSGFGNSIAPATPTGVEITTGIANGLTPYVELLWGPNQEADLRGYTVYRGTQSGVYTSIATLAADPIPYYQDLNMIPASSYWYAVDAFDIGLAHSAKAEPTGLPIVVANTAPPAAITGVLINDSPMAFSGNTDSEYVAWFKIFAPDDTDFQKVNVFRYAGPQADGAIADLYSSGVTVQTIFMAPSTWGGFVYTDQQAAQGYNDTSVFFFQSVDIWGNVPVGTPPWGEIDFLANVTVDVTPPAAPTGITLTSDALPGQPDSIYVQVNWGPSPEPDLSQYGLFRKTGATPPANDDEYWGLLGIPSSGIRQHRDFGVQKGQSYWYGLRAQDRAGNWSDMGYGLPGPIVAQDNVRPVAPTGVTTTTGLLADETNASFVDIAWGHNPETDIAQYGVFKKTGTTAPAYDDDYWPVVGVPPSGDLQYRDMGVQEGQTYWYGVRAQDTIGQWSLIGSGTPGDIVAGDITAPAEITGVLANDSFLTLSATNTTEYMAWMNILSPADADYYKTVVYRYAGASTDGAIADLFSSGVAFAPLFHDPSTWAGLIYSEKEAYDGSNSSSVFFFEGYDRSGNKNAGTPPWAQIDFLPFPGNDTTPPAAPTGIVLTEGNINDNTNLPYAHLTWGPSPEADITLYGIFRKTGAGAPSSPDDYWGIAGVPSSGAREFTNVGLQSGETYWYGLRAQDRAGNWSDLGYSVPTSIAPGDVTPPADITGVLVNDVHLTLSASNTSEYMGWFKILAPADGDFEKMLLYRYSGPSTDGAIADLFASGVPFPAIYTDPDSYGGFLYSDKDAYDGLNSSSVFFFEGYDRSGNKNASTPPWAQLDFLPYPPNDVTPPVAPTGLVLTSNNLVDETNAPYVEATWGPNPEIDIALYGLFRKTGASVPDNEDDYWGLFTTPSSGTLQARDFGVQEGETYWYGLRAQDRAGHWSPMVSGVPSSIVAGDVVAPADITEVLSNDSVITLSAANNTDYISWLKIKSPSDSDYRKTIVYRYPGPTTDGAIADLFSSGVPFAPIFHAPDTYGGLVYTDLAAYEGDQSSSSVFFFEGYDYSGNKNASTPPWAQLDFIVNPLEDTTPPVAPTGIVVTTANVDDEAHLPYVQLTWGPNPENDIATYGVFRKTGAGVPTSEDDYWGLVNVPSSGALIYQHFGVQQGETYWYAMRAQDRAGHWSPLGSGVPSSIVAGDIVGPSPPVNININDADYGTDFSLTIDDPMAFFQVLMPSDSDLKSLEIYTDNQGGSVPSAWARAESNHYRTMTVTPDSTGTFSFIQRRPGVTETFFFRSKDKSGNFDTDNPPVYARVTFQEGIGDKTAPSHPDTISLFSDTIHDTSRKSYVDISWPIVTATDLAGYRIYKTIAGTTKEWRYVTDISATGDRSYRDYDVITGSGYAYGVTAYDKSFNEDFSEWILADQNFSGNWPVVEDLRADLIPGVADGEHIATWPNSNSVEGLGIDAYQTDSDKQPIYRTNIQNGKPGVEFINASGFGMRLNDMMSGLGGGHTELTLGFVISPNATGADLPEATHLFSSADGAWFFTLTEPSEHRYYDGTSHNIGVTQSGAQMLVLRLDSTDGGDVYRDGELLGGGTWAGLATSSAGAAVGLGQLHSEALRHFDGFMHEFVFVSDSAAALGVPNIQKWEGHESYKWDIPLVAGHPYESYRPMAFPTDYILAGDNVAPADITGVTINDAWATLSAANTSEYVAWFKMKNPPDADYTHTKVYRYPGASSDGAIDDLLASGSLIQDVQKDEHSGWGGFVYSDKGAFDGLNTSSVFFFESYDLSGNTASGTPPWAQVDFLAYPPNDSTPPAAPTNIVISTANTSDENNSPYVAISWDANSESDMAQYGIFRKTGAGAPSEDEFWPLVGVPSSGTLQHRDFGVQEGTIYFYGMRAQDRAGNWSSLGTSTPASIVAGDTTSPADITDVLVNDAPITLSAANNVDYISWFKVLAPSDADYRKTVIYRYPGPSSDGAIADVFTSGVPFAPIFHDPSTYGGMVYTDLPASTGANSSSSVFFFEGYDWSGNKNSGTPPWAQMDFIINPLFDTTPPVAPTGIVVTSANNQDNTNVPYAEITWGPNPENDIALYGLFRKTGAGVPANDDDYWGLMGVPSSGTKQARDYGVLEGESYWYAMRAQDRAGLWSPLGSGYPGPIVIGDVTGPAAPVDLYLNDVNTGFSNTPIDYPAAKFDVIMPSDSDLGFLDIYVTNPSPGSASTDWGIALPYTSIPVVPNGSGHFQYVENTAGQNVRFFFRTRDKSGNYDVTNPPTNLIVSYNVGLIDTIPPATPTNIAVTTALMPGGINTPYVDVTWDANTEADLDLYGVFKKKGTGAPASDDEYWPVVGIPTSGALSFRDMAVQPGETYWYGMRAKDNSGNWSDLGTSSPASLVAGENTPPATPTNVVVTTANEADETNAPYVNVTWDANSETDVDLYGVFRAIGTSPPTSEDDYWGIVGVPPSGGALQFKDRAVQEGQDYWYGVRAKDTGGLWSPIGSGDVGPITAGDTTGPADIVSVDINGTPMTLDTSGNINDWIVNFDMLMPSDSDLKNVVLYVDKDAAYDPVASWAESVEWFTLDVTPDSTGTISFIERTPGRPNRFFFRTKDKSGNFSSADPPKWVYLNLLRGGSDTTPPTAPTGVALVTDTIDDTSRKSYVDISWFPSPEIDVAGYKVYRTIPGTDIWETIADVSASGATSYRDVGVVTGSGYVYGVTAYDTSFNESTTNRWEPELNSPALFQLLKADDIPVVASGSNLATWPATIGADGVEATPSQQPLYGTDILNGLPGVEFDRARLGGFDLDALSHPASDYTFGFIINPGPTGDLIEDEKWFDVQTDVFSLSQDVAGNGYDYYDGSFHTVGDVQEGPQTTIFTIESGVGIEAFRDGTSIGTQTTNDVQRAITNQIGLGAHNNIALRHFHGFMHEVAVWDIPLSDEARESFEGYAAWKYGRVSALDSSHTYKTYMPMGFETAYTVAGDTTPPGFVTVVKVNGNTISAYTPETIVRPPDSVANFSWTNPSDTDLVRVNIWRNEVYGTGKIASAWADANKYIVGTVDAVPGEISRFSLVDTTAIIGADKTDWFFFTAVDRAGNEDTTTEPALGSFCKVTWDNNEVPIAGGINITATPAPNSLGWLNTAPTIWITPLLTGGSDVYWVNYFPYNGDAFWQQLGQNFEDVDDDTPASGIMFNAYTEHTTGESRQGQYLIKLDTVAPDVSAVNLSFASAPGAGAKLNWTSPTDDTSGLKETEIYRARANEGASIIGTVPAGSTEFLDGDAAPSEFYFYWLKGRDYADNLSVLSAGASGQVNPTAWDAHVNWLDNSSFERPDPLGVNLFDTWDDHGSPQSTGDAAHGLVGVVVDTTNWVSQPGIPLIGKHYMFSSYVQSLEAVPTSVPRLILTFKDLTGTQTEQLVMSASGVNAFGGGYNRVHQDVALNGWVIGPDGSTETEYQYDPNAVTVDVHLYQGVGAETVMWDGVMMQEVVGSSGAWTSYETGEAAPTTYYDSRVLNRDRINAYVGRFAEIYANNITAGVVTSSDGTTYFDLDNDVIVMEHATETGSLLELRLESDVTSISEAGFVREMVGVTETGVVFNNFTGTWDGTPDELGPLHSPTIFRPWYDFSSLGTPLSFFNARRFVGYIELSADYPWISCTFMGGQLFWKNFGTGEVRFEQFPGPSMVPATWDGGTTQWSEGGLILTEFGGEPNVSARYQVDLQVRIYQPDGAWTGPWLTAMVGVHKNLESY